jgi:hypothetical protein
VIAVKALASPAIKAAMPRFQIVDKLPPDQRHSPLAYITQGHHFPLASTCRGSERLSDIWAEDYVRRRA